MTPTESLLLVTIGRMLAQLIRTGQGIDTSDLEAAIAAVEAEQAAIHVQIGPEPADISGLLEYMGAQLK
jgi:hypothetical protein